MSPFPGEGIDADPNSAIQARNAQMLSEMGAGGHAPTPGATGWPGGMGPQPLEDMSMGLPSHLTQPGSAFVPSPEDRDPNGSFSTLADPNSVPTTPDDETRRMMLSPSDDKVTKLKCPKCGHVQAASNKKCAECGHDLEKARGGKFAKLDASADDLELGKKPDFLKKDEDDDKNKGDDAKSKCPKCKAENPSAAKKCRRCKHNLVGVKGGNFSIPDGHRAKIYQLSLAQDDLREGVEQDGLIWKIACKSGVLALSPGPGKDRKSVV